MTGRGCTAAKDVTRGVNPVGVVTAEPLHHLALFRQDVRSGLRWDCLFMLPAWLEVWWSFFGKGTDTHLFVVRQGDRLLGVAPLSIRRETAFLIADSELIDYSDFILAPSREMEFFSALFDHLRAEGIRRLETGRVRADSASLSCLRAYSSSRGCEVSCRAVDALYELELPETWEGYLQILSGPERHETRRKIRRLESAGHARVRIIEDAKDVPSAMDTFISLFRSNRREKTHFMTEAVESFFRSLATAMADGGLLRLFFLDVDETPAAAAMCFDYGDAFYLYNNGYDRRFSNLSVGLLSKVYSIREAIMRGRRGYNFLRGGEPYKRRLGGHPVKLVNCEVILK